MTGLFNRSEKNKKAIDAQSKRRNTTRLIKEKNYLTGRKEQKERTEQRKKRRKEARY